jgi:hypothetical protein
MSNCFLSNTDVGTQRLYQLQSPAFIAVVVSQLSTAACFTHIQCRLPSSHRMRFIFDVSLLSQIDPLRSMSRGEPEIQSFRTYPASYNPPQNEAPDGAMMGRLLFAFSLFVTLCLCPVIIIIYPPDA